MFSALSPKVARKHAALLREIARVGDFRARLPRPRAAASVTAPASPPSVHPSCPPPSSLLQELDLDVPHGRAALAFNLWVPARPCPPLALPPRTLRSRRCCPHLTFPTPAPAPPAGELSGARALLQALSRQRHRGRLQEVLSLPPEGGGRARGAPPPRGGGGPARPVCLHTNAFARRDRKPERTRWAPPAGRRRPPPPGWRRGPCSPRRSASSTSNTTRRASCSRGAERAPPGDPGFNPASLTPLLPPSPRHIPQVLRGLALINGPMASVSRSPDLGLVVVALPQPARRPPPHTHARGSRAATAAEPCPSPRAPAAAPQVHYYALFSVSRDLDSVLTLYPGNRHAAVPPSSPLLPGRPRRRSAPPRRLPSPDTRARYEFELKYTGYVELASRPAKPRLDLGPLATALNKLEGPRDDASWQGNRRGGCQRGADWVRPHLGAAHAPPSLAPGDASAASSTAGRCCACTRRGRKCPKRSGEAAAARQIGAPPCSATEGGCLWAGTSPPAPAGSAQVRPSV